MTEKKEFVMLVGLPGSGKSTLRNEKYWRKDGWAVISSDDYIEGVAAAYGKTYNEVFLASAKEATKNLWIALDAALKGNMNIVWDQTNLSVEKRKLILDKIPENYWKKCFVFEASRTERNRRCDGRAGKTIPWSVVDSMEKTYVSPTIGEGFDEIELVGGLTRWMDFVS